MNLSCSSHWTNTVITQKVDNKKPFFLIVTSRGERDGHFPSSLELQKSKKKMGAKQDFCCPEFFCWSWQKPCSAPFFIINILSLQQLLLPFFSSFLFFFFFSTSMGYL
jgi:hypothetical protein